MSNDRNKYIILVVAIILLIAGYYLLKDNFTEWNYNLNRTNKNAYGTFLTYELLKEKYKSKGFKEIDKSVIESFRKLNKNKNYNYIFINQIPYYDSATVDTLYKFTESGNTVFISCEELNSNFIDSILVDKYHLRIKVQYNTHVSLFAKGIQKEKQHAIFNFLNTSLKDKTGYQYYILNKADTVANYYLNFDALQFDKNDKNTDEIEEADSIYVDGENDIDYEDSIYTDEDHEIEEEEIIHPIPAINTISFAGFEDSKGIGLNFAVLKHGKGQFVILLSALPFTNYFMRKEKGLEYAEKVLAHLPNQTTIWDNISQEYVLNNKNHGESSTEESPFYFILNNRSLRWAWYLTILGVIIYAIFHAKRRQNIIPIIEPKENNSLKYVETIGQLYFHEEEHIEIANEMRLQFMNYIRHKYYIKTNEIDDIFFKNLSLKSTIDEDKIKAIFNEFNDIIKVRSINQNKLHQLNNLLENFYKNCK